MSRLVYSSRHGDHCATCSRPRAECRCSREPSPPGDGVVRVARQTKGRKGKGVTLITGVPLSGEELQLLARRLKSLCGCGGTVRDGVIEIQGDHRDRLVETLGQQGWQVKRSGG